jgi:hypothetical protein
MDGKKQAPAWVWIALALIVIASVVAYIIFQNDKRTDQVNTGSKPPFFQPLIESSKARCNNCLLLWR